MKGPSPDAKGAPQAGPAQAAAAGAPDGKGAPQAAPGPSGPTTPAGEDPFKFSVLRSLGATYLKGMFGMGLLYVVGHLVVQTIAPQQAAVYLGRITNHFSGGGKVGSSADGLLSDFWLWIGFTVVVIAGSYGFQYLVTRFDGGVTRRVKSDLFATLLRKPPAFYHENDSDRLALIVNQMSNQMASAIRTLLIDPLLQLAAIGVIGATIYKSLATLTSGPAIWTIGGINGVWVIFGVIVLFALSSPWIVNRMGRMLQRDSSAVQRQNLALATLVGGALKAPEEIQAMRAEPVFEKKLDLLLKESLRLQLAQTRTMERVNTFSRLPGSIVLAGFLGLAIFLEMRGSGGQPGTIVQVALLTPLLMGAVQALSSYGMTSRMSWPTVSMIHSILGSKVEESHDDGKAAPEINNRSLEARDLVFSYRPKEGPRILDGASFTIPAGKVTGFVARPGQGKTTFFRLALRFYDWQSGEILLGGVPVRDLPLDAVRRHIVLMSQFPAFFYDTVRENMRVARPDATDEAIHEAARLTGLDAVLERSMGKDALDQDFAAGSGLSGGQKKLFALTRCLLRDPSVLFLDEPTTGMGPLEKFPLIDTMHQALAGRTVVVVDHDIVWQSKFCDYFHVLNGGKIVQSGSADELLSQPGLFQQLYQEASDQRGTDDADDPEPTLSASAAMAADASATNPKKA